MSMLKIHRGDYVHVVKFIRRDYVHVEKFMGDYVHVYRSQQWGFCLGDIVLHSKDISMNDCVREKNV